MSLPRLYQTHLKRAIDLVVVLMVVFLAAPVLLLVAGLVWVFLGRPILFTQERPGKNGRLFTIYKFRTMQNPSGDPSRDGDAARLTRFGRLLRRTSLDELPELFNVLKGDMSLVGPRPLLPEYLPLYTPEQYRRHEVLPGITGWAQIHGRNAVTWEARFALDVWYVDHCTLWVDLRILARTLWVVGSARGVSAKDHVTMARFAGSGP